MRLALALVLLAGCGSDVVELLPNRDMEHGDMLASGHGGGGDASVGVPTPTGTMCAAAVAATLHRFALCSCSPLSTDQKLQTTVFDSSGAATNRTGAAVGFDGDFHDSQPLQLEGALYASGMVTLDSGLTTTESLRAGNGIGATQTANVSTDAYSGSDVSGSVVIGGTLHLPATASVGSSVQAGAIVREAVSIAPPCDCSGAAGVDVAGFIAAAAQNNDDAAAALSPATLTTSASLPSGTFYVAAINGNEDLTLTITGHAALAVAGDVTLANAMQVTLDDDASLDLFIGGTLATQSNRVVGATTAPARVRVWTAATSLSLGGDPIIGAVVTAPHATIGASNGIELYGSLLTQSLTSNGDLLFHYDQAILALATSCGGSAVPAVK